MDVALVEWFRRVPATCMGFPCKSSNLLGDVSNTITAISCFAWFFEVEDEAVRRKSAEQLIKH